MASPTRRTGLRIRLIALVAIALVPALGLLLYRGVQRHRLEATERRHQALELARLGAAAQARRIEGARQLLVALAQSSAVRGGDPEACHDEMRRLLAAYEGIYANLGWADPSGRVVCQALDATPAPVIADRGYFQAVLRTRRFHVGALVVGRLSGINIQPYAYPSLDPSGQVTGVIFANADPRVLAETLTAENAGTAGRFTVVDRAGIVVAQSSGETSAIGQPLPANQLALLENGGDVVQSLPGEAGPRLFSVVPVRDPATDEAMFYVAYDIPEATLLAGLDATERGDIVTLLLFGAGLLGATWIGAEVLVRRPVQRLAEATSALAAGHLDTRVPAGGAIPELDALDAAFNQMAERLQQRDLHLRAGQRLEAIGQLAGGIAHDFNNLLTVIVGYSQSLRATIPDDGPGARELAELAAAADRAAVLTRQLLAFSRRQILTPRPLVLGGVIQDMQSLIRRTIGTDIELSVRLDGEGAVVEADPGQIEQVVLNLAINARDAQPGGGRIHIETRTVAIGAGGAQDTGAPAGRYVELSVRDEGVGMDEETRARVFEPFFTTKGQQGTGLGLSTVYGIVSQSGGFITCETAPGAGTTFRILLPQSERPAEGRAPAAPAAPVRGSEDIIVVEDEEAVRRLVAQLLGRMGYRVRATTDAGEALGWLGSDAPVDLVISDVRMPGMGGMAFFAEARRSRPALPIILMSGDVSPGVIDGARAAGAIFLQKPFTPAVLLHAVRAALGSRPAAAPGAGGAG
ncbi:MAG: ATP-binding protein [Vicinamibacterales bacterium]